jgi:hypothetical protein
MTVSSTSETTPADVRPDDEHARLEGSEPSTDIVIDCQPGSRRAGSTVSMTPPRSATTSCCTSSTVTVTWA